MKFSNLNAVMIRFVYTQTTTYANQVELTSFASTAAAAPSEVGLHCNFCKKYVQMISIAQGVGEVMMGLAMEYTLQLGAM